MRRRRAGAVRSASTRSWLVALVVSATAHGLLLLVIAKLALGAFAVRAPGTRETALVSAEFFEAAPPPPAPPPPPEASSVDEPSPDGALDALAERLERRLEQPIVAEDDLARRLSDRLAAPLAGVPLSTLAAERGASVAFVGLQAEAVESVVYVVDASGSLVGTLPILLDELERSLGRLAATQRFSIVFFQRNAAIALPPDGRLRSATPESVREAMAWARRSVRPSGRSNPVVAMATALALRPDAIFLLSADITGSGEFEIAREDLLAALDRLNPADGAGLRRTRIQCVEVLDPDPAETLKAIAERHGGAAGFRYLSREELGLAPTRRP